jgi:hypothetical protein
MGKNIKICTIYVVVNTKDLSLRACKHKITLAKILGLHRNTITNIENLQTFGDYQVRIIKLE